MDGGGGSGVTYSRLGAEAGQAKCVKIALTRMNGALAPGVDRIADVLPKAKEYYVAEAPASVGGIGLGMALVRDRKSRHNSTVGEILLLVAHSTGVEAALLEYIRKSRDQEGEDLILQVDSLAQVWRMHELGFVVRPKKGADINIVIADRKRLELILKRYTMGALKTFYDSEGGHRNYADWIPDRRVYVYHLMLPKGAIITRNTGRKEKEEPELAHVHHLTVPHPSVVDDYLDTEPSDDDDNSSETRSRTAIANYRREEEALLNAIHSRAERIAATKAELRAWIEERAALEAQIMEMYP